MFDSLFKWAREKRARERAESLRFFGGVLIVFGILSFFMGFHFHQQESWPKATATIVESRIDEQVKKVNTKRSQSKNPTRKEYELHVVYKYKVDGVEYQNGGEFMSSGKREWVEAKQKDVYPVGSKLQISYDPDNPKHATTNPGAAYMIWVVSILTIIGGVYLAKKPLPKISSDNIPSDDY